MKKLLIIYLVFTVSWTVCLIVFNEKSVPLPVPMRVALLYVWVGFIIVSSVVMLGYAVKRKNSKYDFYVLLLMLLNVLILITNPFDIVTNFFG